jgi:hypothetical protein
MNPDFLDLLRAFTAADVKFLVVGAYAVALHGHPRATGDLHVWIELTEENARRAYGALGSFGAPLDDLSVADLARRDTVFRMGIPPVQIDILISVSGVEFPEAWQTRVVQDLEGTAVPFIGLDALLRNKRAAGRPQDLADAAALEPC